MPNDKNTNYKILLEGGTQPVGGKGVQPNRGLDSSNPPKSGTGVSYGNSSNNARSSDSSENSSSSTSPLKKP